MSNTPVDMIIDELKSTLYSEKVEIQTKELEYKTKEWYKLKNKDKEKDNTDYIEHTVYLTIVLY